MTWNLGSFQNTNPTLVQAGWQQMHLTYFQGETVTVDTSVKYEPAMVKTIRAARKAKSVSVPADAAGFMAWLTA